jgi:hypothetical protein
VLDCNVADMVVFDIRRRFDLDQPPALISAALENIDSGENVSMLERTFENRRNLSICNKLPCHSDRLFSISRLNGHAAGKHFLSQQTHLSPLVDDGLSRLVGLHRQFRRVDHEIQTLEALHPGDESGLCDEHQLQVGLCFTASKPNLLHAVFALVGLVPVQATGAPIVRIGVQLHFLEQVQGSFDLSDHAFAFQDALVSQYRKALVRCV